MDLKTARINAGFSQVEAAQRLNVSQTAVSMWESNTTKPRPKKMKLIAELYGVTLAELMKEDGT